MRKRICSAAIAIFLMVFSFSACGKETPPSISVESVSLPPVSQSEAVVSVPEPKPEPRRVVDFETLQEKNGDIIAWVEVPGTVIDYPVMCTTDNAFYLNHDETKAYDACGSIFIDMSNPVDFSAPVTVAYGHITPDDTHFSQLHLYEDPDYFAENREVYVYTPGVQHSYEVVASLLIGNENILYQKDYTDKETMREFIEWIENTDDPAAVVDMDGVDADDQFLVLSTCTQAEERTSVRYIVVARFVETI